MPNDAVSKTGPNCVVLRISWSPSNARCGTVALYGSVPFLMGYPRHFILRCLLGKPPTRYSTILLFRSQGRAAKIQHRSAVGAASHASQGAVFDVLPGLSMISQGNGGRYTET